MVRFSRVVCALLLAGVAAVAGAETVYKWVDTAGQVHYTDLPPRQAGAKILGVYQQEAGTIDEGESGDSDDYSDQGDMGSPPDTGTESPSTPEPPVSQEAWQPSRPTPKRPRSSNARRRRTATSVTSIPVACSARRRTASAYT